MPPIPNREADLSRPRSRRGKAAGASVVKGASRPPLEIEPDPEWHPSALLIWRAGLASGGADFYESSDLAMLHLACSATSHWFEQGGRKSPEMLRVIMQTLGVLLFSEGDRRRLRIELDKPGADDDEMLGDILELFKTE